MYHGVRSRATATHWQIPHDIRQQNKHQLSQIRGDPALIDTIVKCRSRVFNDLVSDRDAFVIVGVQE